MKDWTKSVDLDRSRLLGFDQGGELAQGLAGALPAKVSFKPTDDDAVTDGSEVAARA